MSQRDERTSTQVLRPGLRRLRAPNAGTMTGSGTNTYLLGESELVVIDPGPALEQHVDAILTAAPDGIAWVVVTHTHLDHSPAASLLAKRCAARVAGPAPAKAGRQDRAFAPERILTHGDRLEAAGVTLDVVATPGHASNHLCYWLENDRELMTGDHINQGSTVVIDPPDGDMSAYLASLERLKTYGRCTLLPGHGEPIDDSIAAIDALLAHRLTREAKVLAALPEQTPIPINTLLERVYDDVDPSLYAIAMRSLLAHLLRLERNGQASRRDEHWLRP